MKTMFWIELPVIDEKYLHIQVPLDPPSGCVRRSSSQAKIFSMENTPSLLNNTVFSALS